MQDVGITTLLILFSSTLAQPARSDGVGKQTDALRKTEVRNTSTSADGADAVANGVGSAMEVQLQQLREELKAQQATLQEQQQRISALEIELRSTRTNGNIRDEESANRESATVAKLAIRQQEAYRKIEAMESETKVDKKSLKDMD
jgi:hypothetical protein